METHTLLMEMFSMLKRYREWTKRKSLEKECIERNAKFEVIGKATCYTNIVGKEFTIVYEFMVDGNGKRKIKIAHNLDDDSLCRKSEFKHPMYVKWYKSWKDGSLNHIPIDDHTRDERLLYRNFLNHYYHHYIHRNEIFIEKVIVKPIEEMVISEVVEYT